MTTTTTLNRIRAHGPCGINPRTTPLSGYQKLKAFLGPEHGPDDPIPFAVIARSNGLQDAIWCCRAEPQRSTEWRLFAVKCARRVQHMMTDPRSIAAIDVAERHANGLATDGDLAAARAAAEAAAWVAARAAAWAAAWAAYSAAEAAAWAAAWAAADAAAEVAYSATSAAYNAAEAAADAAAEADFMQIVGDTK